MLKQEAIQEHVLREVEKEKTCHDMPFLEKVIKMSTNKFGMPEKLLIDEVPTPENH